MGAMRKLPKHMTDREFEHFERSRDRLTKIACATIPALSAVAVALITALL